MAPARAATLPEPGPQGVSSMDAVSVAQAPVMVECFRHEGDECPRCDGSGYRLRRRCAGCGESANALQAACGAKSWDEARSLSLYCNGCNPRFADTGLAFFVE